MDKPTYEHDGRGEFVGNGMQNGFFTDIYRMPYGYLVRFDNEKNDYWEFSLELLQTLNTLPQFAISDAAYSLLPLLRKTA